MLLFLLLLGSCCYWHPFLRKQKNSVLHFKVFLIFLFPFVSRNDFFFHCVCFVSEPKTSGAFGLAIQLLHPRVFRALAEMLHSAGRKAVHYTCIRVPDDIAKMRRYTYSNWPQHPFTLRILTLIRTVLRAFVLCKGYQSCFLRIATLSKLVKHFIYLCLIYVQHKKSAF